MTKPKSSRSLSIRVETDHKGPKGLPLVTWSSGEQPVVRATVVLDNPEDSKGKAVIIRAHLSVETKTREGGRGAMLVDRKEVISKREWRMDVTSSKPGYIARGTHTKTIHWKLEPNWPSSFEQRETSHYGKVRFWISATMDKVPTGLFASIKSVTVEQDLWAILPGSDGLDPTLSPEVSFPIVDYQTYLSCFTPSNRLYLHEVVPFTFRFTPPEPPVEDPAQEGDSAIWTIEQANIQLKQISTYYPPEGGHEPQVEETAIVDVTIASGWPESASPSQAWERIVYIVVPGIEKTTASFASRLLGVRHAIKVKAVLRSNTSSKPVTWKHKFDVDIRGIKVLPPSIDADTVAEQLPAYSPLTTGSVAV
ncbi:hypothetical protein BGZ73_000867 [Actinomortierella ambigua]|nr:hypothetical protein BGZ73_000867 [Actinomortierella ambigua]